MEEIKMTMGEITIIIGVNIMTMVRLLSMTEEEKGDQMRMEETIFKIARENSMIKEESMIIIIIKIIIVIQTIIREINILTRILTRMMEKI